jgi:hypothetical protein
LRWDMVDLTQGQLHVRRLKQGRPRRTSCAAVSFAPCVACTASRCRARPTSSPPSAARR